MLRFYLALQFVAHDFHQIVAGQQVYRLVARHPPLGLKHQRHYDQGHMVMPRLPDSLAMPHAPLASSNARSTKYRAVCLSASQRDGKRPPHPPVI